MTIGAAGLCRACRHSAFNAPRRVQVLCWTHSIPNVLRSPQLETVSTLRLWDHLKLTWLCSSVQRFDWLSRQTAPGALFNQRVITGQPGEGPKWGDKRQNPRHSTGPHMKGDRLRPDEGNLIKYPAKTTAGVSVSYRKGTAHVRSWRKLLLAMEKGDYKNAAIVWYTQCQRNLADRPNRGKSESSSCLKPFDVMRCLQVRGAAGKVW